MKKYEKDKIEIITNILHKMDEVIEDLRQAGYQEGDATLDDTKQLLFDMKAEFLI